MTCRALGALLLAVLLSSSPWPSESYMREERCTFYARDDGTCPCWEKPDECPECIQGAAYSYAEVTYDTKKTFTPAQPNSKCLRDKNAQHFQHCWVENFVGEVQGALHSYSPSNLPSDRRSHSCLLCEPGWYTSAAHSGCLDRNWALLDAWQRPYNIPAICVFIFAIISTRLVQRCRGVRSALFDEEVRGVPENARVRLFKRCPGCPQPRVWSWMVLAVWDVLDWAAFLLWYVFAKPDQHEDGRFVSDERFVFASCSILYWGPFLPLFMFVVPRKVYLVIELIFDVMQIVFVQWVSMSFKLDAKEWWLVYLNQFTTVVDGLLLKGPEVLDQTLSPMLDAFCPHPDDFLPLTQTELHSPAFAAGASASNLVAAAQQGNALDQRDRRDQRHLVLGCANDEGAQPCRCVIQ